jgi:very-short-patch-repair endonuclease
MAAVLACQPVVASHFTAAWLLGLFRSRPSGAFHLTAPTQRRPRHPFVLHEARLAAGDITAVDDIPVTSVSRTILDMAGMLRPERFEGVLERSEELGVFDLTSVEGVRQRYAHHPGAGPLREALSIYRDDATVTRSRLEKRFLAEVREAGLLVPAMNFNIAGFELDAYWEHERFAVELDVFETHGTRVAFERDRIRADDLLAIGVEMIRVTGPRLRREPEAVMRRLGEHLAHRRRERS